MMTWWRSASVSWCSKQRALIKTPWMNTSAGPAPSSMTLREVPLVETVLRGKETSVDRKRSTGHVRGVVGGKEENPVRDLGRLHQAAVQGVDLTELCQDGADVGRALHHVMHHRGVHR